MAKFRSINIRLTEEEAKMVDEFQQILQAKYGDELRVTQRTVIVQALKLYARALTQHELPNDIPAFSASNDRNAE